MIRTVPASFEYTCDVCGASHRQENASGHYTDSVPPTWGHLRHIKKDALGCTVRARDVLLCCACSDRASAALDPAMEFPEGQS